MKACAEDVVHQSSSLSKTGSETVGLVLDVPLYRDNRCSGTVSHNKDLKSHSRSRFGSNTQYSLILSYYNR